MTPRLKPVLHAKRIGPTLGPDRARVLLRPFRPTTEDIARRIVARVQALPDEEVARQLGAVLGEFANRHDQVESFLLRRFARMRHELSAPPEPSPERQALLGAYFSHEYSPES